MMFTSKRLDKVFIECCKILPVSVAFISVEKKNGQYSVVYIDENKNDVTYYVKTKFTQLFNDPDVAVSVYDYMLDKIKPLLDLKNFEENNEYIYLLPREKSKYQYLRRGAFVQMRNIDKSTTENMAFKLNVNKNIVYSIENNEIKNYGIDALLKYCFYFRKQPLFFLNNTYRKAMVDNLISELLANKLIKPEQVAEIEKHFIK